MQVPSLVLSASRDQRPATRGVLMGGEADAGGITWLGSWARKMLIATDRNRSITRLDNAFVLGGGPILDRGDTTEIWFAFCAMKEQHYVSVKVEQGGANG